MRKKRKFNSFVKAASNYPIGMEVAVSNLLPSGNYETDFVAGYIFDGYSWYPARKHLGGYYPIPTVEEEE